MGKVPWVGANLKANLSESMRLKSVLLCAVSLSVLRPPSGLCSTSQGRVRFSAGLRERLSKEYPGTQLVSLADLDEHDRKLFQEDLGLNVLTSERAGLRAGLRLTREINRCYMPGHNEC